MVQNKTRGSVKAFKTGEGTELGLKKIQITRPYLDNKEIKAVSAAIRSGWVSQGPAVKAFEEAFSDYVGAKYACAVSSCTTGLHMALTVVGTRPGDVVITVSHSFIATANSVRHCGAEPVFVDIDLDTLNMSVRALKECLENDCVRRDGGLYYKKLDRMKIWENNSSNFSRSARPGRVAAIMPVHQVGMPCDIKAIVSLAKRFGLPVVEDAACAIGSEISLNNGRTWEKIGKPHSDVAVFSFHPRKVITTGEGGMLTTSSKAYDKRFRLLRHHGMGVSDVVRHNAKSVIFEEYEDTGYNYRLSDIHASMGLEQMRKLPEIVKRRRELALVYLKGLRHIDWLELPYQPGYARTNWQSFPVRVTEKAPVSRDRIMRVLLDQGISTRRGVMNAHQERPYMNRISLKNSEKARDSIIFLPIFHQLTIKDVKRVIRGFSNV